MKNASNRIGTKQNRKYRSSKKQKKRTHKEGNTRLDKSAGVTGEGCKPSFAKRSYTSLHVAAVRTSKEKGNTSTEKHRMISRKIEKVNRTVLLVGFSWMIRSKKHFSSWLYCNWQKLGQSCGPKGMRLLDLFSQISLPQRLIQGKLVLLNSSLLWFWLCFIDFYSIRLYVPSGYLA